MLDELLAAGEVTWSGVGQIGGGPSGRMAGSIPSAESAR